MTRITLILTSLIMAGTAIAGTPATASAGDQTKQAPNFEQTQKRILARLDAGIKRMEDARDCVAAATDMASLKACKPEKKAAGDSQKTDGSSDQ